MTSVEHDELVNIGKKLLINLGIESNQIIKEQTITLDDGTNYKIDILGKISNTKILIECGSVDANKITKLRNAGYLTLHLPFEMLQVLNINVNGRKSGRYDKILNFLKNEKEYSFNLICKSLKMSRGTVLYNLNMLINEGKVEKLPMQGAGERPAMVYYKLLNKTKGK